MDTPVKTTNRRNKFAGKENISRETADNILTGQIDQLREISRTNDETAAKLRESVAVLYEKRIPIETVEFEQLTHSFIGEMERKLKKVKQPSRGLKWYIVMWAITLISACAAGYFMHERKTLKQEIIYWYQQYEVIKKSGK